MNGRRGTSYRTKRRSARFTLIILFLVALGLFFSGRNNGSVLERNRTSVENFGSSALHYLTMPLRGLENFGESIDARSKAYEENERLKAELARLSDVEARANAMAIKLSRLSNILNVDPATDIPDQKIAARAVSEINGPFVRSSLINVGAKKGVSKGDAVMTVDGLYGHVIRVGSKSSRVLKLEDLNSRVAVMSKRSQSRAILIGKNSRIPALSYVIDAADWAEGDVVITSGDDGVLPLGLPVGTVRVTADGTFLVDLFIHKNFVDWVWVYPYEEIRPPEENLVELDVAAIEQDTSVNVPIANDANVAGEDNNIEPRPDTGTDGL